MELLYPFFTNTSLNHNPFKMWCHQQSFKPNGNQQSLFQSAYVIANRRFLLS